MVFFYGSRYIITTNVITSKVVYAPRRGVVYMSAVSYCPIPCTAHPPGRVKLTDCLGLGVRAPREAEPITTTLTVIRVCRVLGQQSCCLHCAG